MNLYGFAGGDPVNFSDPFGLNPCLIAGPYSIALCVSLAVTVAAAGTDMWVRTRELVRSWTQARNSAAPEASSPEDDAIESLKGAGRVEEGRRVTNVDRTGEGTSAEGALGEMAGKLGVDVQTSQDGKTRFINLPSGGTASSRPTSNTGPPTVQVNQPGANPIKVRFDKP